VTDVVQVDNIQSLTQEKERRRKRRMKNR